MNKIYSIGDIVYYNDPYFERLGIENGKGIYRNDGWSKEIF